MNKSDQSQPSPNDPPNRPNPPDGNAGPHAKKRLRPSGGYRQLRSFQTATIIYDATVLFCDRFVDKRSRTSDQMVQAARSGRQNIAEGSRAAAISSQTELRLVSVARSSLDELLLDYEDFLRQRKFHPWDKDSPEALAVRNVGRPQNDSPELSAPTDAGDRARWAHYAPWLEHTNPSMPANALICLIHQTNYLLDRQIAALERGFIAEGGYSEQLAAARMAERERQRNHPSDQTDRPNPKEPDCPQCGKPMALRTARKGPKAGTQFWGCTAFPACKGTRPMDDAMPPPASRNHP